MPFQTLTDLTSREIIAGFHGRFVHTDNITFSYWEIEQDAVLPEHSHPHEQISMVVEGRLEMTLDGETRVLEPGLIAVIPGHTPHSAVARTACRVVDVFYPVREDYR